MRWFQVGDGDTPLDRDEALGLLVDVTTRGQLDEVEQANITEALVWARRRRSLATELLTVSGIYLLHQRMFREVWSWAGTPRSTEKTVGVVPHQIAPKLKAACDNAAFWLDEGVYDAHEAAVRYHHKLLAIHPFPNGNGRHARLVADLLLEHRRFPGLRWPPPTGREAYVSALRAADLGDYHALLTMLLPPME